MGKPKYETLELKANIFDGWTFLLREALEDYPHHHKEILALDKFRNENVTITNHLMFRDMLFYLLCDPNIKSKWERMMVNIGELAKRLTEMEDEHKPKKELHPLEKKYGEEPEIRKTDHWYWH